MNWAMSRVFMNRLNRVKALLGLSLVFFLGACSSTPSVVTDYDTGYGFSSLNTFRVESTNREDPKNLLISPFTFSHLERVIEENLSQRYRSASQGATPDFVVRYHIVVEERLDVRNYNQRYGFGYYGFGPFYRYPYYGPPAPSPRVYRQGTLIVDIVSGDDQRPLWRGVSEQRLRDSLSPDEQRQRLSAAVTDILSNFPPVD